LAQGLERGARVEQARIEKVRAGATGLEGELAEAQDLPVQRQVQEAALVRFHGATRWAKPDCATAGPPPAPAPARVWANLSVKPNRSPRLENHQFQRQRHPFGGQQGFFRLAAGAG